MLRESVDHRQAQIRRARPGHRWTRPTPTNDFYEIVVERHRPASTIVTSNREPAEWLTMMSDALLAQSAVDRLISRTPTRGPVLPATRLTGAAVDSEGEAQ